MKKLRIFLFIMLSLITFSFPVLAQDEGTNTNIPATGMDANTFQNFDFSKGLDQGNVLGAYLGMTTIGDQQFVGMRIQPTFTLGKLGIGLNIPIMFNTSDWSFRNDEFKDGIGWLRLVDFVSWGVKKRDPFYIKVGSLYGSYIGYGILVNNYANSISFDKRKMGVSFDLLVKNFIGVEGLYSDFDASSMNMMAIRPYIKPLTMTKIPIVKTLDMGFTIVTDHDNTSIKLTDSTSRQNQYIKAGQKAWAVDIGITPVNMSFMQLKIFAQYGKLQKNSSTLLQDTLNKIADSLRVAGATNNPLIAGNNVSGTNNYKAGSGFSVGAEFKFKVVENTLQINARIERLWYDAFFTPQFYNVGYEINKDRKLITTAQTDGKKGIYGSLYAIALEKVLIGGSLMIPDNVSETAPAVVTIDLDASKLFDKILIKGQYIKAGLSGLSDVFKLDERSLATARVAYKVYKFLSIGVDYKWTWSKNESGTFDVNNYVSPYIGFSMPLNFGGNNKSIDMNLD